MPFFHLRTIICISSLIVFSLSAIAQKRPACLKLASSKTPKVLKITAAELTAFYKKQLGEISFGKMKIARTELSYYLLSEVKESPVIYAFELEQKGKNLFLNSHFKVHSCSEGVLGMDTFMKKHGKIRGCRLGTHQLYQHKKN